MNRFLTAKEIWPRITELARNTKKAHVAVAYFGQDARELLPLKPGSILVVDCHPNSVKGGRTCPHDLLALIKKQVEVHSCSNLHAKVFVFGNRAIIGSANASKLSKNYLLEAAVETTDKAIVAKCIDFISSLRGDQISPAYAKKLCKIWNPPKLPGARAESNFTPRFYPLWVVPLVRGEWDEIDDRNDAQAEPVAKKKITSRKRFSLDKFHWDGDDKFSREVKIGHQLLQVYDEGKSQWVYPPSRVVHLKRYQKDGKRQLLVYLEAPRVKPAKRALNTVRTALGILSPKLIIKHAARRVSDSNVAHTLFQLWPGQDAKTLSSP